MRRFPITVALAAFLLGCGSLPADQVKLLIAENASLGCYLTFSVYDVVASADYGTAIRLENGEVKPLFWPPGYTGHRVGSEVAVWDPSGQVVATTGGRYAIWPADDGRQDQTPAIVAGCINPAPSPSCAPGRGSSATLRCARPRGTA